MGTFSHMNFLIHVRNELVQNFTREMMFETCFTWETEGSNMKINFTCEVFICT